MATHHFHDLGDGAFFLEAGAIVTEMSAGKKPDEDYGQEQAINQAGKKDAIKIWSWGRANDLPQRREDLIKSNNIIPTLLQTKRDITIAGGMSAYKIVYEEGGKRHVEIEMPKEAKDFFDRIDQEEYFMNACKNLYCHANTFTEFIMTKDGTKVASIQSKECRHIRAEVQDIKGRIQNYIYSANWVVQRGSKKRAMDIQEIPGYEPRMDKKVPGKKFIYHTGDDLLSDDYYFDPPWWGGQKWIQAANLVPAYHLANFENGYGIRFHIEYPKDYFDDASLQLNNEEDKKKAQDKRTDRRTQFLKKMNDFLAGIENTGRAVYTSYEINRAMGKEFPGIKITPINVDIKDKALLELFEKSNQANVSAQGIHPTLANIETQGKLSSGSEIRNAFMMYLHIKTPVPRRILLEPIKIIKKLNGWPEDIHYRFTDIEITNLADDKSGAREVAVE